MNNSIVANNALFAGFNPDEIPSLLSFLQAREHHYARGEMLQSIGRTFHHAGIVIKGRIEESCIIENFSKIKLGQFFAGDLYGIPFAIEKIKSPIQLTAQSDCEVIELDLRNLFSNPDHLPPFYGRLMSNLTKFLAHQDIHTTIKLHIASQKNIHDKLIVYLHHLPKMANGYRQVPFSQTELAAFLGVNRSALARTISKMKTSGEIEIHNNKIRLVH